MSRTPTVVEKTFEETYPHHPFAPLVAAGVALARWLKPDGEDRYADGGATPTAMGTAS